MTPDCHLPLDDLRGSGAVVRPGEWAALLQRLAEDGASGYLWWRDGFCSAAVHLVEGRISGSVFGDEQGLQALIRCVTRTTGCWCWSEQGSVPANIERSTAEIIANLHKVLASFGLSRPPGVDAEIRVDSTQILRGFNPPTLGTVLGRCELLEELGRGATSIVYRARHRSLHIDVAVKVLLQEPADETHGQLTANEARLLARLNHPAILRVHDFDDEGPWPYLVIEYVDGPGLDRLIREQAPLPLETVLPIACEVAAGLAYAHDSEGMIHCDLKPGNILLRADGAAKIADLGLARIIRRQQSRVISSRLAADQRRRGAGDRVVGTPAYIAPEQVEGGHGAADQRSDMYALGAIIYHALSGRTLYHETDPVQLMLAHTRGGYAPLQRLVPGLSTAVADLVDTLLARDPGDRFADYTELLARLNGVLDGGHARRNSLFRSLFARFRRG